MVRLVLVLGDQLTQDASALVAADKEHDVVVMAEVAAETTYVQHHPKKIAFVLAAMRKFAWQLRHAGWTVVYTQLDDPANTGSIPSELLRHAQAHNVTEVIATEPGEFRLIAALRDCPLKVTMLEDTRFIASHAEFEHWATGRKQLRMEYFYRDMRRKTGLLMDGDQPEGGKWNYDQDNRKPASDDLFLPDVLRHEPDAVTQDVLNLVAQRFGNHFGDIRPFWFATDAEGAQATLRYFCEDLLAGFGDYQDAMLAGHRFLYHSLISLYLNVGLLDPLQACRAAEAVYHAGRAPLNAVEGFIRQIIGWREYIRGIYFHEGPDYPSRNHLGHSRDLPGFYWGAPTKMRCMSKAVEQTQQDAYAHHIQRLMVTGNFALLAGVDPHQVHEWYLAVYADAYEWVESPNTVGMSQFADGGIVASKPYVSSGAYINKMSDYCSGCAYSVTRKTGAGACPFNLLYWHFLIRHEDTFANNPRMAQIYATWRRMKADRRETVLAEAEAFLSLLDAGALV